MCDTIAIVRWPEGKLFALVRSHSHVAILVTYQHIETVPIFPPVTYSPDRFSRFSSYLEVLPLTLSENWKLLSFKKKLRVWQPLSNSQSLTHVLPK